MTPDEQPNLLMKR